MLFQIPPRGLHLPVTHQTQQLTMLIERRLGLTGVFPHEPEIPHIALAQLLHDVKCDRTSCRTVDGIVKCLIGFKTRRHVVGLYRESNGRFGTPAIRRTEVPSGRRDQVGLQLQAQARRFRRFRLFQQWHAHAAVHLIGDELFRRELTQGFAHRRLADLEALSDMVLPEGFAGREDGGKNVLAQLCRDLFGNGPARLRA